MPVYFWIILILIAAFLLVGIMQWLHMLTWSWFENGKKFTILLSVLLALMVIQPFVKDYAPHYYDLSKMALMVYVIGLVAYRFISYKGDS